MITFILLSIPAGLLRPAAAHAFIVRAACSSHDRSSDAILRTFSSQIEYLKGDKMPADGLSRLGQMVSDLAQLNLKNIEATESEWRLNATSD
jgi:hypothetical protein